MNNPCSFANGSIRRALIGIRFLFFGFGGFLVMMWFSIQFIMWIGDYKTGCINPLLSLLAAVSGAVMMLFGVGEWKRWGYLFVFLSMPMSFYLITFNDACNSSCILVMLVVAIVAFVSNYGVRVYYRHKDRSHTESKLVT